MGAAPPACPCDADADAGQAAVSTAKRSAPKPRTSEGPPVSPADICRRNPAAAARYRTPVERDLEGGPLDFREPDEDVLYPKCRVERLISTSLSVAAGTTSRTILLSDEQTLCSGYTEAGEGRLFLRVDCEQEVEVEVVVEWHVPGSVFTYEFWSETLPVGEVHAVPLWEGPLPGQVSITFVFTNTSGASRAVLVADLIAKRRGGLFVHGDWFVDATEIAPTAALGEPLLLLHHGEVPPPVAAISCGARVARDRRRAGAEDGPGPRPKPAPEDDRPVPEHHEDDAEEGDSDDELPLERLCAADAVPPIDWPLTAENAWVEDGVRKVPDPEVLAAEAFLPMPIQVSAELTPLLPAGVNFPDDVYRWTRGRPASREREPAPPLHEWVGRCAGFEALWREVTQGLERERMPLAPLERILRSATGNSRGYSIFESPGEGALYQGNDYLVGDLVASSDRETDTDWAWRVTAPWFEHPEEFYAVSLLSLVHATVDLLPARIFSPTRKGSGNEVNRHWADWRVTRPRPQWRLTFMELTPYAVWWAGSFNLGSCTWTPPTATGVPTSAVSELSRGKANTRPWPIPSLVMVSGHLIAPYLEAASQTYALARLLTMIAAKYEVSLGPPLYRRVVALAKTYHGMYLGSLALPGKTLVHELFHLTGSPGVFSDVVFKSLAKRGDHCKTGCGQEKMGSAWVMMMGTEYGARYPNGDTPGRLGWNADGSSRCEDKYHGELEWSVASYGEEDALLSWNMLLTGGSKKLKKMADKMEDLKRQIREIRADISQAIRDGRRGRQRRLEKKLAKRSNKLLEMQHSDRYKRKRERLQEKADRKREERFVEKCWDPELGEGTLSP